MPKVWVKDTNGRKLGEFEAKRGQNVLSRWASWMVRSGGAPGMSIADLETMYCVEPDGSDYLIESKDDGETFHILNVPWELTKHY